MASMKWCVLALGIAAMGLNGCSSETEDLEETPASGDRAVEAPEPVVARVLPGAGDDAGKTVIYRDTWGVPHIYAPTASAGLYAMGWAQADDRPEQLLQNILIAIGEISTIAGPDTVQSDLRSRMWDHYGVGKAGFETLRPELREHLTSFANGMNDFYAANPESLPPWWGARRIDEGMLIAFGRLFLYNWSIDEVYGDLKRGGIEPGYEAAQRGSNQWAVSPERSANGAAILYIDPHLSWTGPSRFWALRIHAGDLHGSGVTLPGSPYVGLGHNADVAWAMTTGGPDTADVYELTLKEDDPTQYLYDGEWREMTSRDVTIQVRGIGPQEHTIWSSHHGPIIAMRDGKAYAAKMAYAESVRVNDAWFEFNFAKDYQGVVKGLATAEVFPQNVMVADTSGNIYFQRTGRVPIRSEEFDWSVPLDGSTSDTEWQGIHPTSDLLQVLNPPQGYMQNCNVPPDAMIPGGPFSLENTRPYIYGSRAYGRSRSGWTNQRGARAIQLLGSDDSVTIEEALSYAVDVHAYGIERWLNILHSAHESFGSDFGDDSNYARGIAEVTDWSGDFLADSPAALKYFYWRQQLVEDFGSEVIDEVAGRIDQWYKIVTGEEVTPALISDAEMQGAVQSFATAMDRIVEDFGSLNATYGDRFRVGRDDASWPVGGGGSFATRTLRSVGFSGERDDHTQWGRSGQTSTQIVVMTKPIQSWWYLPLGESDRADSPHYNDLAEKAFSKRQLQPTWWLPEDLADHIESRTVLEDAA